MHTRRLERCRCDAEGSRRLPQCSLPLAARQRQRGGAAGQLLQLRGVGAMQPSEALRLHVEAAWPPRTRVSHVHVQQRRSIYSTTSAPTRGSITARGAVDEDLTFVRGGRYLCAPHPIGTHTQERTPLPEPVRQAGGQWPGWPVRGALGAGSDARVGGRKARARASKPRFASHPIGRRPYISFALSRLSTW